MPSFPALPPGYPPYPPLAIVALMAACQLLFGLGYDWFYRRRHLPAWAGVVGGVAATGAIMYAFLWNYTLRGEQWLGLMTLAFVGSGVPMAVGAMKRQERATHHARPVPNKVREKWDAARMEISAIIHDIEDATANGRFDAAFLVRLVNRLHGVLGILKG